MKKKLLEKLKQSLPVESYGLNGANTWESLEAQIEEGDCTIEWIGSQPVRKVKAIRAKVIAVGGKYDGCILVEEYQQWRRGDRAGEKRYRNYQVLSEKLFQDEKNEVGIVRCLQEELGFSLKDAKAVNKQYFGEKTERKESPSLPGLITEYLFYEWECFIPKELQQDFYIEKSEDVISRFGWSKEE